MLIDTRQLLKQAQVGAYALGAFNIYNLEGVLAVIAAAEAENSPVILQIHPASLRFGGQPLIDLCLSAGRVSRIPVSVHLDHSTRAEHIDMALAAGVQSVMADGSDLSDEDNITFTQQMAQRAHSHEAAIEAELGKISGTEDGLTVAEAEARMTDPAKAADFIAQTHVDMLAICIGNVHGSYPGEPRLDFDRLERIRRAVDVPLVLHGASGLPEAAIRRSIELGICKFNVNTEVRKAALEALRHAPPDADLVDMMQASMHAMQVVIREKIQLFGASGQATYIT